jgi:hypothetical protein
VWVQWQRILQLAARRSEATVAACLSTAVTQHDTLQRAYAITGRMPHSDALRRLKEQGIIGAQAVTAQLVSKQALVRVFSLLGFTRGNVAPDRQAWNGFLAKVKISAWWVKSYASEQWDEALEARERRRREVAAARPVPLPATVAPAPTPEAATAGSDVATADVIVAPAAVPAAAAPSGATTAVAAATPAAAAALAPPPAVPCIVWRGSAEHYQRYFFVADDDILTSPMLPAKLALDPLDEIAQYHLPTDIQRGTPAERELPALQQYMTDPNSMRDKRYISNSTFDAYRYLVWQMLGFAHYYVGVPMSALSTLLFTNVPVVAGFVGFLRSRNISSHQLHLKCCTISNLLRCVSDLHAAKDTLKVGAP